MAPVCVAEALSIAFVRHQTGRGHRPGRNTALIKFKQNGLA